MTREEFNSLQRGDKIWFEGKPTQIWEVDHPTHVHTKKFWRKMGDTFEVTSAGGGDCACQNCCITVSLATPIGRGQKRLTQVINDYMVWNKVE